MERKPLNKKVSELSKMFKIYKKKLLKFIKKLEGTLSKMGIF